jgi:hypothetical protein
MKLALKLLRITLILIIALTILLFSASLMLQDKVADVILKSLNNNISTKFDYKSLKLSFLRRFPKASLELKDVFVHSSPGFNSLAFPGKNTDTLLTARRVSAEFKITDIINGSYNIERITARDGRMNFFTDTAGFVNWDITEKNKKTGGDDLTINLEKINVHGIKAYYNNLAVKLIIRGSVKNGKLKSRIHGENIDFNAVADMEINHFQLLGTLISRTINADIDLVLQSSKKGVLFKKSSLTIEDYNFGLTGFVSSDNTLDLNVSGHNIDIANITKYLPEKYLGLAADYDPSGILVADCKIKGPLTRNSNPHIEISSSLKKGHIKYKNSNLTISDLSFNGFLSNGPKNKKETSFFSIKDLRWKLGSGEYAGSWLLSDFNHPKNDIQIKGRVFPGEIKEFFNIKDLSTAEGSADVDLKLVTGYWPVGKITLADIARLKPEGNLVFNTSDIGFFDNKVLFNKINGSLFFSDLIKADNFNFVYKGQNLKIDGQFRNLPEWLSGLPVKMTATADISMNRLVPEAFFPVSSTSDSRNTRKKAFRLPGDIILDINFNIDSLSYKTFSSSGITGSLNYKPRLLTIKSLNLKSLKGSISGNGFVVQNIDKTVITRGSFAVSGIDVNKAFNVFHNFGQDFIKAENLAGMLSGSLSLLLPLDSLLNPQIKLLKAEGKFTLVDGALLNFEPVKKLSSFIELSELENIHFEQLQNDFFIKSNVLFLPQMDVKSNAADLSINGKHSFDNDYEYHVKVLLSEILSKKRKKKPIPVTEFGAVEDDGLGRTSLLLKVENKGDDIKVSYDLKAVGNEVKNNIKAERQNLKSILNQEYGWYKSDTSARVKPLEKKTRFKIKWDDSDTTYSTTDTVVKKKKKLFIN